MLVATFSLRSPEIKQLNPLQLCANMIRQRLEVGIKIETEIAMEIEIEIEMERSKLSSPPAPLKLLQAGSYWRKRIVRN